MITLQNQITFSTHCHTLTHMSFNIKMSSKGKQKHKRDLLSSVSKVEFTMKTKLVKVNLVFNPHEKFSEL